MVIKRVGPMSVAKVAGVLYALIGLLIGGIFSLVMAVAGGFMGTQQEMPIPMLGTFFGVGAVVVLPIFYGVLGFVGGAIGALIYNLVAGWTGGIEVEIQ